MFKIQITKSEFAVLISPVGPCVIRPGIAVACSGCADSMTLALLTEAWAAKRGGRVTALVIDHSIRENSKAEAQSVAAELASHGVACEIILNNVPIRSADVQATARKIRYELLNKWCVANGYLHLAVAHHQDDQIETFFIRLSRGSGVEGLSSMSEKTKIQYGINLIRPLLDSNKKELSYIAKKIFGKIFKDPPNIIHKGKKHDGIKIKTGMI